MLRLKGFANFITGAIPSEIYQTSALNALEFDFNALTGSVAPELAKLTSLKTLWLNENALTGTIPTELGMMNNVSQILLGANGLTGTIPSELGMLQEVKWVDLSQLPLLTGTIPGELGELALHYDLRNVNFIGPTGLTGTIPDGLCILGTREGRLAKRSITILEKWNGAF